ncbi:MAG: CcmD family protein [Armatimonadetes bacterium]|nr:CcmD family protein [Armatimonadota bacterium]
MNGINPELLVGGVTLIIWIGLFFYLVRLDHKIKDLHR